ncbi:multidrug ABC transporter permease/ATP-binding protein [Candidatus Pantoea edessiphila]|uniref:Multidrug resistance-like ATP-binding protein MdlA n=1 Tax=Candidatus Pantoea edessiphila TaxID=2044610 RepID=A0A2P5SXI3_9GAMM|nr:SmdA family multidrug ABC transporter permease/ATP-binding protein [Candidatus Pantoea edessiphila]MBK4775805.1 SmdA family multidrug ABC transporter permease/ATP-binding protein [Pantoea sp. Edef]PPI87013.1 multidrug ABC transporter permease/ATP-binding protein [Candidatus Pantoea edessiphila]
MRLFNKLSWYFIREWKRYLGAIILLIIVAIMQLLPPYVVGILIDGVNHKNMTNNDICIWIGVMLTTAIIIYILRYVWRVLLFGASYKLAIKLRDDFYRQLSLHQKAFYLRYRTGDLVARVTHDVDCVVFAAGEGVLTLVDSIVMSLIVLVTMIVQINWQLTLIALMPMPFMACFIHYYGEKLHQNVKIAQASFSILNNYIQESITSIRMIKSFGIEQTQLNKFVKIANDNSKKNLNVTKIDACFDPTIYVAIGISNILAVGFGSWLVWHNQITLGQLTRFIMYLSLMIWPMLALAWTFNIIERGNASWNRINIVLSEKSAVEDIQNDTILPNCPGILEVSINKFFYPNNSDLILTNLHFKLEPGKILGICGPTGSGKSTLISLIQRHFEIQEGEIFYHGISLRNLSLDTWRNRLAVVNQNPFLFSDTIANNITLGKPDADQEEIEFVSKIACVHNDILLLTKGYDTEVGERGTMLSGGQRQRIILARALLINSEILILDDSLSAIDSSTENQILINLKHWIKSHTLIMITNHLSSLIDADEILVLHEGKVLNCGKHSKLIKKPGWYKDMYRYQQLEAALYTN